MAKLFVNLDGPIISGKNIVSDKTGNESSHSTINYDGVITELKKMKFKPPSTFNTETGIDRRIKKIKLSGDTSFPFKGLRVNIASWSDVDKRTYMCWGDHWVKVKMCEELEALGCIVDVELNQADITIYLFGSPFNFRNKRPYHYNPLSYNVVWFYSHPEKFIGEEAAKYDYIFCLSKQYLKGIKGKLHANIDSNPLYGCTNFKVPNSVQYGSDNRIVMVANARGVGAPYGREIIKSLIPSKKWLKREDIKINVWGHKWDQFEKYHKFPKEWYAGKYWNYEELPNLYRGAKAVLIDGHSEMEEFGFVPVKLFDVFASGGLPIIKKNKGTTQLFGNYVLQYDDEKSLRECLGILSDRKKCLSIIKKGQEFVREYTYKNVVLRILNTVVPFIAEDKKSGVGENEKRKQSSRIEWVS